MVEKPINPYGERFSSLLRDGIPLFFYMLSILICLSDN